MNHRSHDIILQRFKSLTYPAVYYADAPEGRFACFLFLMDNGFVWLEPGYQEPWDKWHRWRCIDQTLAMRGDCIVFNDGWIGEGNPFDGEIIWHYWLDYRRQFGRNWDEEREFVLHDCLGGNWQGNKLI